MNNNLVSPPKSSIIYIHNEAPSLLSKIIGFVMRMINMKSKVEKLLAKRRGFGGDWWGTYTNNGQRALHWNGPNTDGE